MKTLLSIGHGYAGRATEAALGPGWRLLGTSRTKGAAAVHWPDEAATALAEATHVISWVAPDRETGEDPILPLIASQPMPRLEWLGYASASSLYGDTGGAWIDESAPDRPDTGRGTARLKAEAGWRALAEKHRQPLCVLRIAGIYGPGRSSFDALREGRAQRVVRAGQVFNRIHVEDLGRIAAAAAETRLDGPLIVSDDEPAPNADVIAFAASLLGMDPPPEIPFEEATLSPMARSFWADNKRLRSCRIGPELKLALNHPTYRDGLKAIHARET
ncbi:SDR family NAD(P)-dependent oxidoreductase [Rhodobacter sp. NTK016B]|uniref:SDR family NAD(P)-dependent oxidoreductase n=1 Tax=Rhodobacter sp. NTK016B TaxID=2759676 RepID=UPI001A8C16B2|nr:SDR family NAD(P)-dependent oxidoreductase [Rhodobacter sp. NTK016B]MBN8294631.1 SDR family NAD(P)-dependent oxidoreductase [Rhodobacter sp. NTK016B]